MRVKSDAEHNPNCHAYLWSALFIISPTVVFGNNKMKDDIGPREAVSVGLQQYGATIQLGSRERNGYGWRSTGLFGEPWGGLYPSVDFSRLI